MIPPYLDPAILEPGMRARPVAPFFVRARDYRVIDGDTIRILAPKDEDGKREEAFRIRMFSIDSPEKPKRNGFDHMMAGLGLDPHVNNAGRLATAFLRKFLEGKVLLIEPTPDEGRRVDSYGRLLAKVTSSGRPSFYFVPEHAVSVEYHLMTHDHARLLGKKKMPEEQTALLAQLQDHVHVLNSFSVSRQ